MNTKTWLPLFSGFYGTMWETDSDEEMELDNINTERAEKSLAPVGWDDVEWNYKDYKKTVATKLTQFVEDKLITLGVIKSLKFEAVKSPREYNFMNDSIHVVVRLTPQNLKAIEAYLQSHVTEFQEYLENKYTSYDGFISFHSNNINVWIAEGILALMAHEHKAGAVLNFILECEGIEESDAYEDIKGNGGYLYATNYTELIGA